MSLAFRRAQKEAVEGESLKALTSFFKGLGIDFEVDWESIKNLPNKREYSYELDRTVNIDIAEHVGRYLSSGLLESFTAATADDLGKKAVQTAWKKVVLWVGVGDDKEALETANGTLTIRFWKQYNLYDLSGNCPSHLAPEIERHLSAEASPAGGLKFLRAKKEALANSYFQDCVKIFKDNGVDFQVDWDSLEKLKDRRKYSYNHDLVNADIAEHIGRYLSCGVGESFKTLCADELGREAVKETWKRAVLHVKLGSEEKYEFKTADATLHITVTNDYLTYDLSGSSPSHLAKDIEKLL